MRVTLDGTPLLGERTGIGRYVQELVAALPAAAAEHRPDAEFRVTTWSARRHRVPDLPPGVRQVGPRVPARLLREAWLRSEHPTAELLAGRGDVVHGTNFVVPPTRRARAVVTVHDLTYLDRRTVAPTDAAYAALVPRALRRGAHVVTPTAAVAAAVRDHYRLYVGSAAARKNVGTLVAAHRELTGGGRGGPALVLAGPAGAAPRPDAHPGVVAAGWLADDE